jgi:hypothetical protein
MRAFLNSQSDETHLIMTVPCMEGLEARVDRLAKSVGLFEFRRFGIAGAYAGLKIQRTWFNPKRRRHILKTLSSVVEQRTLNPFVVGSTPTGSIFLTFCKIFIKKFPAELLEW